MTDFDLDRLGEVWRAQPDPAEMAALQRSAETVRRRARMSQVAEAAAALVVSGIVIALAISNPRVESLVIGTAGILLMLVSGMRQRQLRRLELKSLTGSTEEMLDQSIARVEATLKRNRLSLISFLPGLAIGISFAAALDGDGRGLDIGSRTDLPFIAPVTMAVSIAALAGLLYYLFQQRRDAKRELSRLQALREAYRQESEAGDDG